MDTMTYHPHIVACLWDFDKTLIPGYMQGPLFAHYGVDPLTFWKEVNALPESYRRLGYHCSMESAPLNHLLSYIKHGPFKGLNNKLLREFGALLELCPGLPDFFRSLQDQVQQHPVYSEYGIRVEHYIISTGLAEVIRGSPIGHFVEQVYGCELLEAPFPPGYLQQAELPLPLESAGEITQIGVMVDNTIKTRFIFEINKGVNKNPRIDVNTKIPRSERRIPFANMIYIADGPTDVPVFAIMKHEGGRTFAVYDPDHPEEFAQNDALLQSGRIHAYGPRDYRPTSSTAQWIRMHVQQICNRIVAHRQADLEGKLVPSPQHLHKPAPLRDVPDLPAQQSLWEAGPSAEPGPTLPA